MVDHRPLTQAGFTTLIPAMARNANGEECAIERLNLSKTLERLNLVGTYGPLMTGNDPLRSLAGEAMMPKRLQPYQGTEQ
jgi:hypothetical protein